MSYITMTNKIMHIHLSSWRYFAALTLPQLALIFDLLFSASWLLLMGLFLLTHYYCWRLWLDERLFNSSRMNVTLLSLITGWRICGEKERGILALLLNVGVGQRLYFIRQFFLYWRCGLFHRALSFIRLLVNQAESETAQTLIAP